MLLCSVKACSSPIHLQLSFYFMLDFPLNASCCHVVVINNLINWKVLSVLLLLFHRLRCSSDLILQDGTASSMEMERLLPISTKLTCEVFR